MILIEGASHDCTDGSGDHRSRHGIIVLYSMNKEHLYVLRFQSVYLSGTARGASTGTAHRQHTARSTSRPPTADAELVITRYELYGPSCALQQIQKKKRALVDP